MVTLFMSYIVPSIGYIIHHLTTIKIQYFISFLNKKYWNHFYNCTQQKMYLLIHVVISNYCKYISYCMHDWDVDRFLTILHKRYMNHKKIYKCMETWESTECPSKNSYCWKGYIFLTKSGAHSFQNMIFTWFLASWLQIRNKTGKIKHKIQVLKNLRNPKVHHGLSLEKKNIKEIKILTTEMILKMAMFWFWDSKSLFLYCVLKLMLFGLLFCWGISTTRFLSFHLICSFLPTMAIRQKVIVMINVLAWYINLKNVSTKIEVDVMEMYSFMEKSNIFQITISIDNSTYQMLLSVCRFWQVKKL